MSVWVQTHPCVARQNTIHTDRPQVDLVIVIIAVFAMFAPHPPSSASLRLALLEWSCCCAVAAVKLPHGARGELGNGRSKRLNGKKWSRARARLLILFPWRREPPASKPSHFAAYIREITCCAVRMSYHVVYCYGVLRLPHITVCPRMKPVKQVKQVK